MKVAAIGDNCIDLYENLDRYYCTGNAVDFAVHMKRLGEEVSVISTTGIRLPRKNSSPLTEEVIKVRSVFFSFSSARDAAVQ